MSYYGPEFASICSGWYWTSDNPTYSTERDETLRFWNDACDSVIHRYVERYGTFFTAFERDIAAEIKTIQGWCPLVVNRYFCYFLSARAWTVEVTRNLWLTSNIEAAAKTFLCSMCSSLERLVQAHPDVVYRSGGLPRYCRKCDYHARRYEMLTPDIFEKMRSTLKTPHAERSCDLCGQKYSLEAGLQDFQMGRVDLLYPNLFTSVCHRCFTKSLSDNWRVSKATHLKSLKQLFDLTGRVPTADYSTLFFACQDQSSMLRLLRILMKSRSPTGYAEDCGSFFSALIQAGVLPAGSRKMCRGAMIKAKDGHICFSIPEMEIDDYLHTNGVAHTKEVTYPGTDLRADWELKVAEGQRVFVEYFGMMSNPKYAQRARIKASLAKDAGIHLIEIYPYSDFKQILKAFKKNP